MIRSSKTSIKFANSGRKDLIGSFISEYLKTTQFFVDILWNKKSENIPSLIPKEITNQVTSWLSQRAIQCSAKQASGIVRGTIKKQKDRLYRINKLNSEGKFKQARKLQVVYDKQNMSKPEIKNISPELDSRFIKINLESETSFDGWITINSLGLKEKIFLPFKKTEHFNKMLNNGKLKQGIRISKKFITFNFEIPDVQERTSGTTLGIDIGISDALYCSNGYHSTNDKDGHNLVTIQNKLSRRKKGSVGFRKAQTHRKNYINHSINLLNLEDVRQVNIEDIKNMGFGKNSGRFLNHFVSAQILDKIENLCVKLGVQVKRKSQTYTSQRCSMCGWVRKSNRKGKQFKCTSCGFACDADLNASINISLDLPAISKEERLSKKNRKGFFWNIIITEIPEKTNSTVSVLISQKPIVSDALRA